MDRQTGTSDQGLGVGVAQSATGPSPALGPQSPVPVRLVDLVTDDRDYVSAGKAAAVALNFCLIPLLVFVVVATVWFGKILPEGLTAFVALLAAIINGAHKASEAYQRHLSASTESTPSTPSESKP